MKKDKQKLTKFIQKHWIAAYFCAALIIAVVVNIGMRLPIVSFNTSLKSDTWLTFWGSYLGGAIGCLPALAALYDNREEARRQHEENKESHRLAVIPVISCEICNIPYSLEEMTSSPTFFGAIFLDISEGFHDAFRPSNASGYKEKLKQYKNFHSNDVLFTFKNIGTGPALNVAVSCLGTPQNKSTLLKSIGSNETTSFRLYIQIPSEADDNYRVQYDIEITFSDIFGNYYVQVQPLICTKDTCGLGNISRIELIKKS